MSQRRTFGGDLADGQQFEERVLRVLGGTRTSAEPGERDRGDIVLADGTYVECKHDKRFDGTGNVAFELADLEPRQQSAVLTGVFKHSAHAERTVMVHGLGTDSWQFLVYSPFAVHHYLATHAHAFREAHRNARMLAWDNGHRDTTHRTVGLVMPLWDLIRSRTDHFPVECVSAHDISASVARIANYYTPTPRTDQQDVYAQLTRTLAPNSADLDISRYRRVKVKGTTSDQVHALVRGQ